MLKFKSLKAGLLVLVVIFVLAMAMLLLHAEDVVQNINEIVDNITTSESQDNPLTSESQDSSLTTNTDSSNDENSKQNDADPDNKDKNYSQNNLKSYTEILVKYKNSDESKIEINKENIKKKLKLSKLDTKKKIKSLNVELLEVDSKEEADKVIYELQSNSNIEYAQPNYKLEIASLPQDTYFTEQWGLMNNGQSINESIGVQGVDINVLNAWETTEGSNSITVGILDTGIDIGHSDIASSVFTNQAEIQGNGIDDDGNGFVDDINGWDFANNDNTVYDSAETDKHGTSIAGIISASKNSEGICGVAPNVKILPLKFMNGNSGYTSDVIEAIAYAQKMGVKIINCSFCCSEYNYALMNAIEQSDMLFVCAAGNNSSSLEATPVYPACYNLKNILAVSSISNNGLLANFSNYGSNICVAAPGVDIKTTLPGNNYGFESGTSMSTAYITGIAALLESNKPQLSCSDLAYAIKNNITPIESLNGKVILNGVVNANGALINSKEGIDVNNSTSENSNSSTQDSNSVNYAAAVDPKLIEQLHYGENGVNPCSGNYSFSYTDISLPAAGFNIEISRTYNSKDDSTGPFGRGWSFGFEGSIKDGTDSTKIVTLPNGGIQRFSIGTNNIFTALDSRSKLELKADNTYVLTTKDQYTYTFSTFGWLCRMADKNDNAITINVDQNGKISSVKDYADRTFTIHYNASNLIDTITLNDEVSRSIVYTYDNNLLSTVADANGNVIQRYTYYPTGDPNQGLLKEIKDANSNIMNSITYYTIVPNIYKVNKLTDKYGNYFIHEYFGGIKPWTTITDKNGRQTIKYYDSQMYTIQTTYPDGKYVSSEYFLQTKSSGDTWKNVYPSDADTMDVRSLYSSAGIDNNIYTIGGETFNFPNTTYLHNVDKVNINSRARSTDYSVWGSGIATVVMNNNIYTAGGCREDYLGNRSYLKSFSKYTPRTNTWNSLANMSTARSIFSLGTVNNKIYAIGGYNGSLLSTVEVYNPSTNTWNNFAPLSEGRDGAKAIGYNGKIYLIGGYTSSGGYTNSVLQLDTNMGIWTSKASMPAGLSHFGAALFDDKIYVVGDTNKVYIYNISANTWVTKTPVSKSYSTEEVVNVGGRLFTIGQSSDSLEIEEYDNWVNSYGEEKSITDRNGNTTQYERDTNGNITKQINPDSSTKIFSYDSKNNIISEKDEIGRYTYYIYDSNKINLLKKVQPTDGITSYTDGVSNPTYYAITTYTYYTDTECQTLGYKAKGLLKTVTDPMSNVTTYTYDSYGNVKTQEDGEHKVTTFTYNKSGWKTSVESPSHYRTDYLHIPAYPDGNSGGIRTINRHYPDTL